ncbi:helix-turn-helix transcriptional regulator [Novosphingobium sp. KA1]|uniref:helix-turn-helix domain-containing protein n=1 Tax=Novosphingobium sp. (strain KA1) TaxID=164608 RepID=UPI001A90582C|nr:helix-turn-helix transcriptional regulator [Novosphingobium sp. KA1]QSR15630.1 hypothetical protein CA833_00145 [Novosphingobium sp. KA1]
MSSTNDRERNAIFAEEAFVVDAQLFLHSLMEEKGFTRADLANAMGVSRARISQVFSDECKNFTLRLFARAVHALGETPTLNCQHFARKCEQDQVDEMANLIEAAPNVFPIWQEAGDDSEAECVNSSDQRLAGLRRKAA